MSAPPCPPFIDGTGIPNLRDVGYCNDGKSVRTGLLLRAADPSKATPEGLQKLRQLGVKKVFDLRSTPEIQRDGPEWAGVEVDKADVFAPYGIERSWQPVFATQDYSPDQIALRYQQYVREGTAGFVNAYRDIMKAGAPAYGTILRHLAQPEPTACIVHCTAGKDRTGVIVALILLLLDVPREEICREYSLTDEGLKSLRPLFMERLMKNPALGGDREGIANMISSKAENMNATIDMINADFGGAEKYIREHCKLSDSEVEQLKKNLHA